MTHGVQVRARGEGGRCSKGPGVLLGLIRLWARGHSWKSARLWGNIGVDGWPSELLWPRLLPRLSRAYLPSLVWPRSPSDPSWGPADSGDRGAHLGTKPVQGLESSNGTVVRLVPGNPVLCGSRSGSFPPARGYLVTCGDTASSGPLVGGGQGQAKHPAADRAALAPNDRYQIPTVPPARNRPSIRLSVLVGDNSEETQFRSHGALCAHPGV